MEWAPTAASRPTLSSRATASKSYRRMRAAPRASCDEGGDGLSVALREAAGGARRKPPSHTTPALVRAEGGAKVLRWLPLLPLPPPPLLLPLVLPLLPSPPAAPPCTSNGQRPANARPALPADAARHPLLENLPSQCRQLRSPSRLTARMAAAGGGQPQWPLPAAARKVAGAGRELREHNPARTPPGRTWPSRTCPPRRRASSTFARLSSRRYRGFRGGGCWPRSPP